MLLLLSVDALYLSTWESLATYIPLSIPFAKKSLAAYTPAMNIQKLIKQYGSQQAMAKAFGVTEGAVSHWVKAGKLPQQRLWQVKAGLVKPPQAR